MTPEQEEQVRRALADARASHDPVPPEVVDRLDSRLAELAAERARDGEGQGARPAAAPEPARRRWPQAVLAAAAVVVVVVGGGFLVRQITSGSTLSTSSGSAAQSQAKAGGAGGGSANSAASAPDAGRAGPQATHGEAARGPVVVLHRATLRHDVRGYLDHASLLDRGRTPAGAPSDAPTGGFPAAGCATPALAGRDKAVGALLDGRPVTLVLRAPQGGTRVAQVYSCDDPTVPVAGTTLPAHAVQPAR